MQTAPYFWPILTKFIVYRQIFMKVLNTKIHVQITTKKMQLFLIYLFPQTLYMFHPIYIIIIIIIIFVTYFTIHYHNTVMYAYQFHTL